MIPPDANYRPIPADAGLPMPAAAIDGIGSDHLLVDTVTTAAGEAWQNDGAHHQPITLLELEGRYNRTDQSGYAKTILTPDAARMVSASVVHTLAVLEERRLAIVDVAAVELLVARALAGSCPGELGILDAPDHLGTARKLVAGLTR